MKRNKKDISKDIKECLAMMNRIVKLETEIANKGNNITEEEYNRFNFLSNEFNTCIEDYHHFQDELEGKPLN